MKKIAIIIFALITTCLMSSCGPKKIPDYPLSVPPLVQEEHPEIMSNYKNKEENK